MSDKEYIKTLEEQNESLQKKLEKTELKLAELNSPMSNNQLYETIHAFQGSFDAIAWALTRKLLKTKESDFNKHELFYKISDGKIEYDITITLHHEFRGWLDIITRKKTFFVLFHIENESPVMSVSLSMNSRIDDVHIIQAVKERLTSRNFKFCLKKANKTINNLKKFLKNYD